MRGESWRLEECACAGGEAAGDCGERTRAGGRGRVHARGEREVGGVRRRGESGGVRRRRGSGRVGECAGAGRAGSWGVRRRGESGRLGECAGAGRARGWGSAQARGEREAAPVEGRVALLSIAAATSPVLPGPDHHAGHLHSYVLRHHRPGGPLLHHLSAVGPGRRRKEEGCGRAAGQDPLTFPPPSTRPFLGPEETCVLPAAPRSAWTSSLLSTSGDSRCRSPAAAASHFQRLLETTEPPPCKQAFRKLQETGKITARRTPATIYQ